MARAANQPPVANSRNLTTPEDTPLSITLAGNDPEGASLKLNPQYA